MIIGVAGCLVLGVGGGLAVRAVADVAPVQEQVAEEKVAPDGKMRVAAITGGARVLSRTGVWRPAKKDDVIRRPSGFDVRAGISSLSLAGTDVSLSASNGAHGVINGPGQPLRIYLDDGHVVVQSPKELVTVVVAREGAEISGRSFGVKIEDGRVLVAGIGREVEVKRRGQSNKFPQATEALLSSLGFRQVALPEQLTVTMEGVEKKAAKWAMRGRTSPTAWVMLRAERGAYQAVPVEADGRFTAMIDGQSPVSGELIAYDSAGRTAEVGAPSGAIDAGPARAGHKPEVEPATSPSGPDTLFPEASAKPAKAEPPVPVKDEPPVAAVAAKKDTKKDAKKPAKKGGKPDPGDEDSITLGDFGDEAADPKDEPASKSIPTPTTEAPPSVETPTAKPEKVPAKPKEEDDEVKLDW